MQAVLLPSRASSYYMLLQSQFQYDLLQKFSKKEMLSVYEMLVLKIDHAILKIDSCQTTQLSQSISKDGRVTAQIDRGY